MRGGIRLLAICIFQGLRQLVEVLQGLFVSAEKTGRTLGLVSVVQGGFSIAGIDGIAQRSQVGLCLSHCLRQQQQTGSIIGIQRQDSVYMQHRSA